MSFVHLPAQAWRRARAAPGYASFSVLMLAAGIAAVTCSIALIRAVLAPPGGVADVDRLITISATPYASSVRMAALSWPDFMDLRRAQSTMTGLLGFVPVQQIVTVDGASRFGTGELVTANYFDLLGVAPRLGRVFTPADEAPDAPPVAIISERLWERLFEADPGVVGRTLHVNGRTVTVVGVAPAAFGGLFANGRTQALTWLPMSAAGAFDVLAWEERERQRDVPVVFVRGRSAGAELSEIHADVTRVAALLDRTNPIAGLAAGRRPWVARYTSDIAIDETMGRAASSIAVLLLSAAALVLLVVCSNLGNLTIAEGSLRRHELATRLALGASRWGLVRDGSAHVALMAGVGGLLAAVLTYVILGLVDRPFEMGGGVLVMIEPRVDAPVVLGGLASWVVAVLVAGVFPAWVLTRRSQPRILFAGSPRTVAPRWRGRSWLIGAQVAVSMVLLATAGLFLAQAASLARHRGGLDLDRFALAEVDFDMQRVPPDRVRSIVERVLARLSAHPEIETAAVASGLPFGMASGSVRLRRGELDEQAPIITATPAYFDTIGLQLVHGRPFSSRDSADTEPVAIVDAALARRLFGRSDVVGERIDVVTSNLPGGLGGRRIVGVTEQVQSFADGASTSAFYVPWEQAPGGRVAFLARSGVDASRLERELRSALAAADRTLGVIRAGAARAVLVPARGFSVTVGVVSSLLGGAGLVVVLAGLYGVLSSLVTWRMHEIGVRIALGASPATVLRAVVRAGMAPVFVGMAVAGTVILAARYVLLPRLTTLLPEAHVEALVLVPMLLLVSAAAACYLPARRAARINPAAALRH